MGDDHAVQGAVICRARGSNIDGREFSVSVTENETLGQPWRRRSLCHGDGIAGSLTEALNARRPAWTRWLEKRYQLNSAEVPWCSERRSTTTRRNCRPARQCSRQDFEDVLAQIAGQGAKC